MIPSSAMAGPTAREPLFIGRYAICDRIAAGGMATVHLGRLLGEAGFSRTVAIKRLHPQYAMDVNFAKAFLDEARLASRIRHPNVVPTLDVVSLDDELFLVMEYVAGEPLGVLLGASVARDVSIPLEVCSSVILALLHGLHAAHEAKSDHGYPLDIVHRDVSPQNVLVGSDGVGRVVDFGIAKALGQLHVTREGQLRGKLAYMAPEQVQGQVVTRQADVFAASVVLWEMLARRRLFKAESEGALLDAVLSAPIEAPSRYAPHVPLEVDQIVLTGLSRNTEDRYASAEEMALALEEAIAPATARWVGEWVRAVASERLQKQADLVADIEATLSSGVDSAPTQAVRKMDAASPWTDTPADTTATVPFAERQPATQMSSVAQVPMTGPNAARTTTGSAGPTLESPHRRVVLAAGAALLALAGLATAVWAVHPPAVAQSYAPPTPAATDAAAPAGSSAPSDVSVGSGLLGPSTPSPPEAGVAMGATAPTGRATDPSAPTATTRYRPDTGAKKLHSTKDAGSIRFTVPD